MLPATPLTTRNMQEASEILAAAGKLDAVMFTANGPAGVFALYVPPGTNLGRVFLNEFVCVRPPSSTSPWCTWLTILRT